MSQWGEERTFEYDGCSILVLPCVDTGAAFDPINLESKIGDLFLMSVFGDKVLAGQLFERIKQQYVGRPYAEWRRQAPPLSPGYVEPAALKESPRQAFLRSQGLPMNCDADQFSDSVVCPCGVRFDINDKKPPKCGLIGQPLEYQESVHAAKRLGIALREHSPRQVALAQRRLSALYNEPAGHLSGILDTGGRWLLALALFTAGIVIGWQFEPVRRALNLLRSWFVG